MSSRTKALRAEYKPAGIRSICLDRLRLFTESYKLTEGEEAWMRAAKAIKHFCEKRPLWINNGTNCGEGELIIGSISEKYRGASAYPEYAVDYYVSDLEVLQDRKYRSFIIDPDDREEWISLLQYWKGKCVDDIKTSRLKFEVPEVYIANQMGLGFLHHEVEGPAMNSVDYEKVLRVGFEGLTKEIKEAQKKFKQQNDKLKVSKLESMRIACEAVIIMANRYAKLAEKQAMDLHTSHPKRSAELMELARICAKVPAKPADTFHEALQSFYLTHVGLWIESNGPVKSLGRIDKAFHPYYMSDVLDKGIISDEHAQELMECFLLKINELERLQPLYVAENWPSNYQTATLGGINPETGHYDYEQTGRLILRAIKEMRVQQPTITIRWTDKLNEEFIFAALDVLKDGLGYPAFQGDPRNFRWLRDTMPYYCTKPVEVPSEHYQDWAPVGCEETEIPGKTSPMLLGRINFLKLLQLTLNNGFDNISGIKAGPDILSDFESMDELWAAYKQHLDYWVDVMNKGTRIVHEVHNQVNPLILSSLLVTDCIGRGSFILEGGALYDFPAPYRKDGRYNHMGYGVANASDSLAAISKWVFEEKRFSLKELNKACLSNWKGKEELRRLIIDNTPHYGNDDPWADEFAHKINEMYHSSNTICGMWHSIGVHVTDGRITGASLDGRFDGDPLTDAGVSPVQGADTKGPTAVIRSVGRFDPNVKNWCQLLNMWLQPAWFTSRDKMRDIMTLLKVYFENSLGNQIQFNVVNGEVLKAAKAEPEKHQELIVRISGFSHYFVDLTPNVQDEIISRTQQNYK